MSKSRDIASQKMEISRAPGYPSPAIAEQTLGSSFRDVGNKREPLISNPEISLPLLPPASDSKYLGLDRCRLSLTSKIDFSFF